MELGRVGVWLGPLALRPAAVERDVARELEQLGYFGDLDALVAALVASGDEAAVVARVEEHLAAGADHVCVQAVGPDPLGDLRRLAAALART